MSRPDVHTQPPWLDERTAPNSRSVRENFTEWFGSSKVLDGPMLSPEILKVCDALRALPFCQHIRVFGSAARPRSNPNDLDVFVDLRGTDAKWDQLGALLRIARTHYGLLDPFLRTDQGLLVRNDVATGWTLAKNARALEAAMDRDAAPLPDGAQPLVAYHGTSHDFDAFKGTTYLTSHRGQAADYAANSAEVTGRTARVLSLYVSLQNPAVVDGDYAEWAGYSATEIQRLTAAGHDGLVNEAMTEIVAFRPEQIKSATDNSGDFDPANPRITDGAPKPRIDNIFTPSM